MIGVAVSGTATDNGVYTKNTAWMFDLCDGYRWTAGSDTVHDAQYAQHRVQSGDVVDVFVDMSNRTITWHGRGVQLGDPFRLPVSDDQLKNLVPAIDLRDAGDSVTFL